MKLKFKFDTQQKKTKNKKQQQRLLHFWSFETATLLSDLKCSNISKKEGK